MIRRWYDVNRTLSGGLAVVLAAACERSPPPVLFHSDAHPASTSSDAGATDSGPGDAAVRPAVSSSPVLGDGASVTIDGVSARASNGERFTHYLTLDPDGDGDRDLLVVRARADGAPLGLGFFRREAAGFAAVAIAGNTAPSEPRCTDAALRSASPSAVVVSYRCGPAALPGGDAGGAPGGIAVEHVVVSLAGAGAAARLRVSEASPGLPDTVVDLAVDAMDRDGDGTADVVIDVGAHRPADRPELAARAQVVLFDRAGGYARDTAEPEASFARLANVARLLLQRRRVAETFATIDRIVRLRRVLCSDGGVARIHLGADVGVPCGASPGLRLANEVLARAYIATGELPAALVLTRRDAGGDLPAPASPRLTTDLLRVLPAEAGVIARPGPSVGHALDALSRVRASALVLFPAASPVTIEVRGPAPARVALPSLALTAAPPGDTPALVARDPDGSAAIRGIYETCSGAVVALCPANASDCLAAPVDTALPPAARVVHLTAIPAAESAVGCLRDPSFVTAAPRGSGAQLVGFGRQGLLVAYRGRIYRVGASGDTATPLTGTGALGGPFPPGSAASESADYLALPSSDGVLVRDATGHWHRWSPANLAGRFAELTDLTVSNDGRTVASVSNGQLWLLERPAPAGVSAGPVFVPGAAPPASIPSAVPLFPPSTAPVTGPQSAPVPAPPTP